MASKSESRCGRGFVTLFFSVCPGYWTLPGGMRPGSRKQRMSSERGKRAASRHSGPLCSSGVSNGRPQMTCFPDENICTTPAGHWRPAAARTEAS
ncbi:rCG54071 [Rattus norvegicus]|uniref:RCG54071 n=1 Tax=Rattus norvegicus TaxID=10116 RepID=A6JAP8_RAT|nr:rCG54071 [Rattus norvegicus]